MAKGGAVALVAFQLDPESDMHQRRTNSQRTQHMCLIVLRLEFLWHHEVPMIHTLHDRLEEKVSVMSLALKEVLVGAVVDLEENLGVASVVRVREGREGILERLSQRVALVEAAVGLDIYIRETEQLLGLFVPMYIKTNYTLVHKTCAF